MGWYLLRLANKYPNFLAEMYFMTLFGRGLPPQCPTKKPKDHFISAFRSAQAHGNKSRLM
jgi:hypothetical protein